MTAKSICVKNISYLTSNDLGIAVSNQPSFAENKPFPFKFAIATAKTYSSLVVRWFALLCGLEREDSPVFVISELFLSVTNVFYNVSVTEFRLISTKRFCLLDDVLSRFCCLNSHFMKFTSVEIARFCL